MVKVVAIGIRQCALNAVGRCFRLEMGSDHVGGSFLLSLL